MVKRSPRKRATAAAADAADKEKGVEDEEGEGEDDASASAGVEFQEKLDDFERAIREVSERMEGLAHGQRCQEIL